jgi:hypothetical protein
VKIKIKKDTADEFINMSLKIFFRISWDTTASSDSILKRKEMEVTHPEARKRPGPETDQAPL